MRYINVTISYIGAGRGRNYTISSGDYNVVSWMASLFDYQLPFGATIIKSLDATRRERA